MPSPSQDQPSIAYHWPPPSPWAGHTAIESLWSYSTDDWVTGAHAADIDGDGKIEVLIGSRDGSVRVLDAGGTPKAFYNALAGDWVGAIHGINGRSHASNQARVLVGSRNNYVVAFDEKGTVLWRYTTGLVVRSVHTCDLDGDGKLEVLIGSEDCLVHVLSCEDGQLLWTFATNGWVRTVRCADLDQDGEIEVLAVSGDKHLYVLNPAGELKWKLDVGSKIHALLAADVDNDGCIELILGTNLKNVLLIAPDGKVRWNVYLGCRIHSLGLFPMHQGKSSGIVAASEGEHVYFLDNSGCLIDKHALGCFICSAYVIDIDGDGQLEILVGSGESGLHVFRLTLLASGRPSFESEHVAPELRLISSHDPSQQTIVHEQTLTLANVERLLAFGDYFTALSTLLALEKQRVQCLFSGHLGHIRAITLLTVEASLVMEAGTYIAVGTDEGDVKLLDITGQILWSSALSERIRSMQATDVDQDGELEILVGCTDNCLYVLNSSDGQVKWRQQFAGWLESICTTDELYSGISKWVFCGAGHTIYAYQDNFIPIMEPIVVPHDVQVLRVHDLDGDGALEIVAGTQDGSIYVFSLSGQILWTHKVLDRIKTICICDIDRDGQVEILAGSEDRNIYVFDHTGQLRWYTAAPHRVLDIDAHDVDHDGNVEIFAGVGDGGLYVMNGFGDDLWQFTANDRVRVVALADVNRDGNVEIIVGTEDRFYLLQMLERQQLSMLIEQCWQALLTQYSLDIIYELLQQSDPHLRAFALKKLVMRPALAEPDKLLLNKALDDKSPIVKQALADIALILLRMRIQKSQPLLEKIFGDATRETHLALLNVLPALCEYDPQPGFTYLGSLLRNTNKWIRRTAIRKLDLLLQGFPAQVLPLLLTAVRDDADWVRQEAVRVLAHYFDVHTDSLLTGARLLITYELPPTLLQSIIYCSSKPIVQNVFTCFTDLLTHIADPNLLPRLQETRDVLENAHLLAHSKSFFHMYDEFHHLYTLRSIEEIAQYRCRWLDIALEALGAQADELQLRCVFTALAQINAIALTVQTYLRRSGLGDRLASLLETTSAIDTLANDLSLKHFAWCRRQDTFVDYCILKGLLQRWRGIITGELTQLRGSADLYPELCTQQASYEELTTIVLSIRNKGRSPADNVRISLHENAAFTLVSSNDLHFECISTHEPLLAEFTLQPHQSTLYLAFTIVYDDAEARGKEMPYGNRLDLVERATAFQPMDNPYYTGTPIQNQSMFYGRRAELAFLREKFVRSLANTVIVLYGQRRSGKSSLLYRLIQSPLLDPHVPVRIDVQNEALNFSTTRFLYSIALAIWKELKRRSLLLAKPQRHDFTEDATLALDAFLDDVEELLGPRKLIIFIDEFEVLEEKVKKHELDPDIFMYLRSLMQERAGIHFLLAGTHTIKELTAEYWSVFFNIAIHHRLSTLSHDAAVRLITKPLEGMLEYDPFAIEKICRLTGDHPYLIQLVCHDLVYHCNCQQKNYITVNDVNAVQESVMETGNVHFNWIWGRASVDERIVLSILAQEGGEEGRDVSLSDIERVYLHSSLVYQREKVLSALRNLYDEDVVAEGAREHCYKLSVGLTRTWLRREKLLQRVLREENSLEQFPL